MINFTDTRSKTAYTLHMANIKPKQPTCRGSHAALLEAANGELFDRRKLATSTLKRNAYAFIINARRLRVTYQLHAVLPQ